MAGESNVSVIFYHCTSEDAREILGVLERHSLHHGHHGYLVTSADRGVILGYLYSAGERWIGDAEELAADLIAASDSVVFQTWSDPDGEGLGKLVIRVPELGDYASECDSAGDPVHRSADLRPATRSGYAAMCGVLGIPWLDEVARLAATLPPEGKPYREVPAKDPDDDELAGLDDADREDLAHELNAVLHRVPVPTP